ncbi:hypothetical protein [Mumia zhuanghuii]|uniref:Uncharacterized protein n=1 Tax=Mumia zhuanghuii TaxID=2585211 RepID=A0A5C4M0N5_9ACTN|nr:hypothetical protein [Mumia zhuanghuii]TNC26013.1 hypothetical protein FHE65_34760 [Mumia zhuanghuii]
MGRHDLRRRQPHLLRLKPVAEQRTQRDARLRVRWLLLDFRVHALVDRAMFQGALHAKQLLDGALRWPFQEFALDYG